MESVAAVLDLLRIFAVRIGIIFSYRSCEFGEQSGGRATGGDIGGSETVCRQSAGGGSDNHEVVIGPHGWCTC